ncbi:hypothetical protein V6N12_008297 [Hibiscus sabdariffa]|uniref:RRM domain-containing protein n=1 Tax=Hibiscus sabdariffa TaxID=183260 RepID=A0ABR2B3B2_9ROSI
MSTENPKQIKKRTPLTKASNSTLKSSVSEKLLHLLGHFNYTHDSIRVLTEYVVVLVSNGKCQSEAKAELEPFLVDTTTEFVSWLWDILHEDSNDSNANKSSSDAENITGPNSSGADDVSANIRSQKSGSGSVPRSQLPALSNTLAEETNEYASALSCKSKENFRAKCAFENNKDGSLYGCSFKTKASADVLLPYEQHLQHAQDYRTTPLFKHSQETNVGGRRLFSRAAGAIFHQNEIRPGNVWDRLGKLTENDSSVKQVNECVNMKRQMLEKNLLGFGQNKWIPTVLAGEVHQNLSPNCNVKTYRSNGGRKRQLDVFIPISSSTSDIWDHEEGNSRKFTVEPGNYSCMLKESDASCKPEKSKRCNKCCKSALDASIDSIPEKTSQEKFGVGVEDLDSTQTQNSDGDFPAETGGIRPVQAQLVNMKLRLHKLETEIYKLKTKPLIKDESSCSGHFFPASIIFTWAIPGSVDQLKEGVQSRTVIVTNVATKDALRSYFASCGPVNRIIKLTNTSTMNQKWSAYVTFTTNDSVGKAFALNGRNFFSRIIWVSKKSRKGSSEANMLSTWHTDYRGMLSSNKNTMAHKCTSANEPEVRCSLKSHNSSETAEDVDEEYST